MWREARVLQISHRGAKEDPAAALVEGPAPGREA